MKYFNYGFYLVLFGLFLYALYLITIHLFQGDLMFHTDIARDFLLIEELIINRNLTLIGPKAGGIPGMFFGPVWMYLNVPFFIFGSGNPVVISYFWVFLVLLSVYGVFYISYKVFNITVGLISALIYSFFAVSFSTGFTQSFGSVLLAPWLIYSMMLYMEKSEAKYLIAGLLINGFIYQLQPAVGMITLPVTIFVSVFKIVKDKKYIYFVYYLVLLIPFSSYILFDLRHEFLQLNSFIKHFTGPGISEEDKLTFSEYVSNRMNAYLSILDILKNGLVSSVIFIFLYLFMVFKIVKNKIFKGRTFYILFFSYLIGFVIMSLVYKGIIIDYYFWAFLPLSIIATVGLSTIFPKLIIYPILFMIILSSINSAKVYREWWKESFSGLQESSWTLNQDIAEYVFSDSKQEFGYFVYSPDEFGHSVKYAMNYTQHNFTNTGYLCKKMNITYLIYTPTPEFAKTDPKYWKKIRVNINKDPESTKQIKNMIIERYNLTNEELEAPSDPNLVCNLHFR